MKMQKTRESNLSIKNKAMGVDIITPLAFLGLQRRYKERYLLNRYKATFNIKLFTIIVKYLSKYYNLESQLILKSKKYAHTDIRYWLFFITIEGKQFTLTEIASHLGYNDYRTVWAALKVFNERLDINKVMQKDKEIHVKYFRKKFNMFAEEI